MFAPELIEKLKGLPQDKPILCQVVGQESGAWNMGFDINDIENSWMIQLKVNHPQLINLPIISNDQ